MIDCCGPLSAPTLSDAEAQATAELFRVLGDPARVKIVAFCPAQPTVSHHLKRLVAAGLLVREQRGRWAYYSLADEAAARLSRLADLKGVPR